MTKKLSSVLHSIDMISSWTGKVLAFVALIIAVIIFYGVIMRYVFNSSPVWAHDLTLFMFTAYMLLLGAYTLYHRFHVNMDLLYSRFSPRKKAVMDVITFTCFCFVCILLIWKGSEHAGTSLMVQERLSSAWRPYIYPVKLCIPLATFLLLLQGVAKFIRDLFLAVKGRALE